MLNENGWNRFKTNTIFKIKIWYPCEKILKMTKPYKSALSTLLFLRKTRGEDAENYAQKWINDYGKISAKLDDTW